MNVTDTKSEPIIRVHELSATFPNGNGGLKALDGLTFNIFSQEFVCILGPSGGGKSTLLRLIAGLLPVSEGEICFQGLPIAEPQKNIGFVFQKANLMPWRTVIENIMLPLEVAGFHKKESRIRSREMIDLVGLQGFENTLPADLSGGMEQRVAIARALIHDPQVLLLDEPFGALDALTRERMGSELMRIWQTKRKTVVMVTHSISEAIFLSDRIMVLSRRPGKIRLDLPIEFPRPRDESILYTPYFGEVSQKVRTQIGDS